ncbi:unnamed protein product [Brachionus calyciflorus]|uniref:AAA-ATPase-like domain-containing protein n=1 Tax=Brachionus calyciflorus TaxID=104777 RepID=A0A813Y3Y8_9BILA|nr:unnamed protein product [Brachionus calyciflorus]
MSIQSSTSAKRPRSFSFTSPAKKKTHFSEEFFAKTAVGEYKFRTLVEKSTIFIDKSLLIKELIEDASKVFLVTCPRRWGKSINLDMIKTFFEIEVDKFGIKHLDKKQTNNYKLFKGEIMSGADNTKRDDLEEPLKIAHDSIFFEKYQGEYPVIMIDFKDIKGSTFMDIYRRLKIAISYAFEQHKYLSNVFSLILQNNQIDYTERIEVSGFLNIFQRILSREKFEATQFDIEESLLFLSKLLHRHFGKRVIILIDEYDVPINNILQSDRFPESEIEQTLNIFRIILSSALKGNEYLEKGFITGCFRLAKSSLFSDLNNLVEFNFLNNKFAKYYGFIEQEIKPLFDEFNIKEEDQQKAYSWYDGYSVTIDSSLKIFNPWSIVNFLNNKKVENYWEETANIDFFRKLFKVKLIKEKIECLLSEVNIESKVPILVDLNGLKFSLENLRTLKEVMFKGDSCEINKRTVNLFLSYIFAAGYLTVSDEQIYLPKTSVKLPNKEVSSELEKKLIIYYDELYSVETQLFKNVTIELAKLFYENDTTHLKNSLEELFLAFPKFLSLKTSIEEKGLHGNEDLIHSVINFTALQIKELSNFGTEVWYKNKARADIVLINEIAQCGMIIEIKYEGSSDEALMQASKYLPLFDKYSSIQKIMTVGINVSSDKKVDVKSKLELK